MPPDAKHTDDRGFGRLGLAMIVALAAAYLAGALVTFDYSTPAYPYDEETRNGRPVAIGPRPREWVLQPTYAHIHSDGTEWPFVLCRPLCLVWCRFKGFEPGW